MASNMIGRGCDNERLHTLTVALQNIAKLGEVSPPSYLTTLLARSTARERRTIFRSSTTSTILLTKAFVDIALAGGVASINCLSLFEVRTKF